MGKRKKDYTECTVLWRILYALALAQAIDNTPFHFNPHKLPYSEYLSLSTWRRGTRAP